MKSGKRQITKIYWKWTPLNKQKWKKNKKWISLTTRNLLETKLWNRNLIKGINIWAPQPVRYLGSFLKWIEEELQEMTKRSRKLSTIHKVLLNVDTLYISRKEGRRRRHANIEESVDTSIWGLKVYIKKNKERLITVDSNSSDNIRTEQLLGNRYGKKYNCMDISSDKLMKSYSRRHGHGYWWETINEKLNLF